MIFVKKHPNFAQWFKISFYDELVDEVKGKARALRRAKEIANGREVGFYDQTESTPKR
jgi:hypothetical protein